MKIKSWQSLFLKMKQILPILYLLLLSLNCSAETTISGGNISGGKISPDDNYQIGVNAGKNKNYVFKPGSLFKWDEVTGNWGTFEVHGRNAQNGWNLGYEKNIVKDGNFSIRFETKEKDCGKGDCNRGQFKGSYGRSELGLYKSLNNQFYKDHGEVWYAWSMFIPEETVHIRPAYTIVGQFKEMAGEKRQKRFSECKEDAGIRLGFELVNDGLMAFRELCWVKPNSKKPVYEPTRQIILQTSSIKNRWLDFLLHVNWSFENDGFINLWINNRLAFQHKGVNSSIPYFYKGKKPGVAFRFGIYNGKRSQKTKPQIIYYDSFKRGNSCLKTALWHDCENLPDNKVNSVKGKYRIKWYDVAKNTKTNKFFEQSFITSDDLIIEEGSLKFLKLGSSNIISDKYREKIQLKPIGFDDEKFIIFGNFDLDSKNSKYMEIIMNKDNKIKNAYNGLSLYEFNEKKSNERYIKIVLKPIK